jgi:tRNA-uridine 2-sulfurtransferase
VASRGLPDGRRGLYRAADPDRDQSYFLYATTPEQLSLLRFPLGELPKDQTRALAREFGLTVAEKADSQDICFVTQGRYSDVIERLKPGAVHGGEIVHLDGRVLGRHEGIIHYTVGQRKGLGLSVGEPLYVVRLDAKEARVIVGPREALATRMIRITDVNWLGDVPLDTLGEGGMEVAVRVRSTREPRPAILRFSGTGATVELLSAEDGVSPGQACVIYESDAPRARVLGGGTIARTSAEAAPVAA